VTDARHNHAHPPVTIVTPSLNQGVYIADAIDSVLAQDYPNIEYLVVDGGSTDATLDILESYGDRLQWVSERDRGQADAINKGFRRARGDILGWLNADDVYAPEAIARAVAAFASSPDAGLVYGNGAILDEAGRVVRDFHEIEPFSLWRLVHCLDFVLQPAAFFRRALTLQAGLLDEDLEFGLDWDLWIRLAGLGEVRYLDEKLGFSRVHGATKTSTGGWRRIRELRRLAARHAGRAWTPGVQLYALDTLGARLANGGGRLWQRGVRRLQRSISRHITEGLPLHADGWLGPRGRLLVPRRWGAATVVLEAHRAPAGRNMLVDIIAEGRRLARRELTRPGELSLSVPLPPGNRPFVELRVHCDFSFTAPPDRRRLSLRCTALEPCAAETLRSPSRIT
jgi:glycosyltransferase involved in cell wall biosynthesis